MNRCDEILDKLQAQAKCEYVSDLHQAYRRGRLRGMGALLPSGGVPFTLEDWSLAIFYITGTEQTFPSVAEAVRFLERPPVRDGPEEAPCGSRPDLAELP